MIPRSTAVLIRNPSIILYNSAVKKNNTPTGVAKPVFDRPSPALLRAMPYNWRGKKIEIVVESDEFTCLCPWSGLPDFAKLRVAYTPDAKIVELKSFKYYIQSYRMTGILHEDAANRILEDLVAVSKPLAMKVELVFNLRGGIKTTVTREYSK